MKHTPLNSKGGGLSHGVACSTPSSSTVTVTELTGYLADMYDSKARTCSKLNQLPMKHCEVRRPT